MNNLIEYNKSLSEKLECQTNESLRLKGLIVQLEEADIEQENIEKQHEPIEKQHDTSEYLTRNTETDRLQDLIINYLNLIKSYKVLVEQLDQAKIDNTQLKISYNSLNTKYMKLKPTNDDEDESEFSKSDANDLDCRNKVLILISLLSCIL
jgi:hypothetical protein